MGWVEDSSLFIFHGQKRNWSEAEAICQTEGGHLVSVTSKELDLMLKRVSAGQKIWLGGKKESNGEWSWSDNSTWEYTNWKFGGGGDGGCVYSSEKGWSDSCGACIAAEQNNVCTMKNPFICHKTNAFKEKKTLQMIYTKDQLNYSRFFLWYRYKTTSQQLLDSWNDKRMTGLRLSWRIKNPTITWSTSINEVGRGIQTPQLADTDQQNLYKATFTLQKNIQEQLENGSLVIELDIDLTKSDKVYAFTSYKLYRYKWKTRPIAMAHCESEGGQLVSIHSQWEQDMAVKAAEGAWVWLSGWKNKSHWQWEDNTTLSYTNWADGHPGKTYEFIRMNHDGSWESVYEDSQWDFLCQGKVVALNRNGLTSIEFTKEQLNFFPFHVIFISQGANKTMSGTSSEQYNRGFILNWFLKDRNGTQLTEKLPSRQEDWNQEIQIPMYKQPMLSEMVQLAQHLRTKENMTREEIVRNVLDEKLRNISILLGPEACSMGQIKSEQIEEFFPKLVKYSEKRSLTGSALERDKRTWFEIFQAIGYCPIMNIKLFLFFNNLLDNESSRTIVQTIVNLFHSKAIKDRKSKKLMADFYAVLASTLGLEYGNILLATSTKSKLQTVMDNNWPFFTNNTDLVRSCLLDLNCDFIQEIIQKLGLYFIC